MTRLVFAFLTFLMGISGAIALQSSPKTKTATATTTTAAANSAASSRRQWLVSSAGLVTAVATTSMTVTPANADPSIISTVQGPIQDAIAPGHWIGQFIGLNSRKETWDFPNSTPEEVSKAIVDVLEGLTPERRDKLVIPEFKIQTATAKRVHVLTWTKLEWLDTLDVTLSPSKADGDKDDSGGCRAKAKFYATGFLPTIIPLAPLLNIGMAWFPFASPGPRGEMLQEFRLRALKGLVTKKLEENIVTPDLYFP